MLTEDDVVRIVCKQLQIKYGYEITSFCLGTQQGDDIVATRPGKPCLKIECKGDFSPGGKEFSRTYLWRCAAGAVFNTIRARENATKKQLGDVYAIAIPDTEEYHGLLDDLCGFFDSQGIPVIWVKDGGVSEVWGNI